MNILIILISIFECFKQTTIQNLLDCRSLIFDTIEDPLKQSNNIRVFCLFVFGIVFYYFSKEIILILLAIGVVVAYKGVSVVAHAPKDDA